MKFARQCARRQDRDGARRLRYVDHTDRLTRRTRRTFDRTKNIAVLGAILRREFPDLEVTYENMTSVWNALAAVYGDDRADQVCRLAAELLLALEDCRDAAAVESDLPSPVPPVEPAGPHGPPRRALFMPLEAAA